MAVKRFLWWRFTNIMPL